jgi:hypothetical protein
MERMRYIALAALLLCTSCGRSQHAVLREKVENAGAAVLLSDAAALMAGVKTNPPPRRGATSRRVSPVTNSLAIFGNTASVTSNRVSFTTGGLGSVRLGITFVVQGKPSPTEIPEGCSIHHWITRNTGEGYQTKPIYPKEEDD